MRPYLGIYRILGQWGLNRVPSPRHYARNARKGPSESGSGPSPKPRSRACPSARSRPPRVSAPVGTQLLGSDKAREIPRWQLSAAQAEPTRRTTPRRRPRPRRPPGPPCGRAGCPPPVPRVAGASGPRGTGRGEPAARDRSRDGIRRVRPPPRAPRTLSCGKVFQTAGVALPPTA